MEVCSSRGLSVSEDLKNLQEFNNLVTYCELSADPEFTPKINENFGLNDLGSYLTEFLTIQDDQKPTSSFTELYDDKGQGLMEIETDDISRDSNPSESASVISEKCPSKCETCPCSSKTLKLVSAMKGSREKQGTQPRKLTVNWAPDVYDPPPSALLPVSTSKIQRHKSNSKKSVKNKKKVGDKSSRSSKGKDKKQACKYPGSFNSYFK